MGRLYDYDYAIRIPLKMIQLTEPDGKAYPLAFDWECENGGQSLIKVDKVYSRTPCAEQKSGVVGDRYECLIGGKREDVYYSLIAPRKWFKLKPVTEEEYRAYYRLPGERQGAGLRPRTGKGPAAADRAGANRDESEDGDPGRLNGGRLTDPDEPSNPGYVKDPKLRRERGMKIAEDPKSGGIV